MNECNNIFSYNPFPENGSTVSILYQINRYKEYGFSKKKVNKNDVQRIKSILEGKEGYIHHQKKIPNIRKAFEICQGKKKEVFIIYNNKVINLTSRIAYNLKEEEVNQLIKIL